MKDYKKTKGHFGWFILIGLMIGLGMSVWQFFIPSTKVDEKAIQAHINQDSNYKYFYEKLTDPNKSTYQRIYYALSENLKDIVIEETDIEIVQDIFTSVIYDHPELYYVNSQFEYRKNPNSIEFMPQYDYNKDEIEKLNQQIKNKTDIIISKARKETSRSKQARYVYDYLVENVEYQENKKTDQNILSSLLEEKSVCAGYARAYQYLLNELGIKSAYIVGTAKESNSQTLRGDRHAWVMVYIDKDYYYCDPTWGDIVEKEVAHTCHAYFMMSSDEMLKLYDPEDSYEKTKGNKSYYFQDEGSYLEKYDEKVMSKAIRIGLDNKSRVAEIKCANENVYERVKRDMKSSYLGYRLLTQNGCWSDDTTYACIDELKLIEIYY